MNKLRHWVDTHPGKGATYDAIAASLHISRERVAWAAEDLRRFGPAHLVVRVPSPRNGYTFAAGWNNRARQGEANQARHLATRLETQKVRLERASGHETDPARAAMMRMVATTAQATAVIQRDFAHVIEP
jgi:hypothetical protein